MVARGATDTVVDRVSVSPRSRVIPEVTTGSTNRNYVPPTRLETLARGFPGNESNRRPFVPGEGEHGPVRLTRGSSYHVGAPRGGGTRR